MRPRRPSSAVLKLCAQRFMKRLVLFLAIFCFVLPLFAEEKQATTILLDISRSIPPKDFQSAKKLIQELLSQSTGQNSLFVFGSDMKKIDSSQLASVQATESYTM